MRNLIYAPVKGQVIDITQVNDPVFSEKMIGDGMAVIPNDPYVCSPISGIIESIFPTNHAFIVHDENNHQVLVHIGLDTVDLTESVFDRILEPQTKVHAGDPVIKANFELIEKKGFDPIVIVVLTEGKILAKTQLESIDSVSQVLFTIQ